MAEVFLAHDRMLGRDLALKVLKEHYAKDERFVGRFWREAQSAAALNHPNADRLFNPATHGCRWLDGPGGGGVMSSGPYLRGSCFRGWPPWPRSSVIVTPPIGRTHNEQVCPNVVQIYDQGRAEDGRYYIVMEHVPGGSL